jgi:deoxyribose-phosphate aldolase
MVTKEEIARMVDHTNLNPDTTQKDIEKTCQEAIDCGFGQVCVRPNMVKTAADYLSGKNISVVSVVGFPKKKSSTVEEMMAQLNQYSTENKVREAWLAVKDGASEIDMIIDLDGLLNENYAKMLFDMNTVIHSVDKPVKVIIETCFLPRFKDIYGAMAIAQFAGAAYVKTSTGFGTKGAQIKDVELMSAMLREKTGIKASGGINNLEQAIEFYNASQIYKNHPFRIGASKLVNNYLGNKTESKGGY